jgi:hypothetical protein
MWLIPRPGDTIQLTNGKTVTVVAYHGHSAVDILVDGEHRTVTNSELRAGRLKGSTTLLRPIAPGTQYTSNTGTVVEVVQYINANNVQVRRVADDFEFKCNSCNLRRGLVTGQRQEREFVGNLPDNTRWVVGFEGHYAVDTSGVVWSAKTGQLKKLTGGILSGQGPSKNKDTYHVVCLSMNGVIQTQYVHRLVAKAFIPNPSNLPQVNHIDGVKLHNEVTNLEWVTPQGNSIHALTIDLWGD